MKNGKHTHFSKLYMHYNCNTKIGFMRLDYTCSTKSKPVILHERDEEVRLSDRAFTNCCDQEDFLQPQ